MFAKRFTRLLTIGISDRSTRAVKRPCLFNLRISPQSRAMHTSLCALTQALVTDRTPEESAVPAKVQHEPLSTSSRKYVTVFGAERIERYQPGGYHPVSVGDIYHDRWKVINKLGYGGYSTVWLARDMLRETYVALKIGASDPWIRQREIEILSKLSHESIPKIFDHFHVVGINGTHPCYTTEYAQGTLSDAIERSALFPIESARILTARLVQAVAYIHSKGIVHGDIRIRNLLVKNVVDLDKLTEEKFREDILDLIEVPVRRLDDQPLPPNVPSHVLGSIEQITAAHLFAPKEAKGLLLADFGEAYYSASEQRLGKDTHIPFDYQPPEVHFEPEAPLSFPSDIWSMGVAIWIILGFTAPFSPDLTPSELIEQQIAMLDHDNLPGTWRKIWDRKDVEGDGAALKHLPLRPSPEYQWSHLVETWEEDNQSRRRRKPGSVPFCDEEAKAALDMMRGIWRFRPEDRLTAEQVLDSEWMVKWALPQLEAS